MVQILALVYENICSLEIAFCQDHLHVLRSSLLIVSVSLNFMKNVNKFEFYQNVDEHWSLS
jgi:hypothetical protein